MSQKKGSKGPSERAKKAVPETPRTKKFRAMQRLLLNPDNNLTWIERKAAHDGKADHAARRT